MSTKKIIIIGSNFEYLPFLQLCNDFYVINEKVFIKPIMTGSILVSEANVKDLINKAAAQPAGADPSR